ncbi:hypothetical protein V3C99_004788 [Haemonchus contortus]
MSKLFSPLISRHGIDPRAHTSADAFGRNLTPSTTLVYKLNFLLPTAYLSTTKQLYTMTVEHWRGM